MGLMVWWRLMCWRCDPGSVPLSPFLAHVLLVECRKARMGGFPHTSVALEFDTIVGADGSCLFAPCALAWPVAYLQLPRLIGKGDETEGILCQLDDLLVMLREKLDHDKNLFRT